MDEFEKRLKQDAADIKAEVSPQLQARIAAAVHSAGRDVQRNPRSASVSNIWWASSLTGLAAAVIVIVLMNLNQTGVEQQTPPTTVATTVPDHREYLAELQENLPLRTETVEFSQGLDEEWQRLQADLAKARQSISRDVEFTF